MRIRNVAMKKRTVLALLLGAGLVAALLATSPATADERHTPRGKRGVALDPGGRVHVHVPRRIDSSNRGLYGNYRAGRIYYKPHHHRHVMYRLPVLVRGAVVYRPYYYCGSNLFLNASVQLPRLAISIDLHPHELFPEEIYGYYGYGDDDDDGCDVDDRHHRHHHDDDDDDD